MQNKAAWLASTVLHISAASAQYFCMRNQVNMSYIVQTTLLFQTSHNMENTLNHSSMLSASTILDESGHPPLRSVEIDSVRLRRVEIAIPYGVRGRDCLQSIDVTGMSYS